METTENKTSLKNKTVFILDDLNIGGSQKLTQDIIELLNDKGHEIMLLVLYSDYTISQSDQYNNKIMFLKLTHYDILNNIVRIYDKIKEYDYIITSMNEGNLYVSILKASGILSGKTISIVHGRDSFYIEDNILKKELKKQGALYNLKIKILLQLFYRYLDAYICVSSDLREYLIKIRKINPVKIKVQQFGTKIDVCSRYAFLEKIFYQYMNRFIILYSGRVTYAKGLEEIMKVILLIKEKIPNILLIIVGEGELKDNLMKEVKEYDLYDHVVFIPFVEDVLSFIAISNVYISMSSYESTNIGVQQAMLLGKVVLCSDVGGIRDLVDDNSSGILYNKNDLNDFVEKLYRIYSNYDRLKNEFAYNAKHKILEDFNLYKNINKIRKLIYND